MKSKEASKIFAAWLSNNFGSKHFVHALWETGVEWKPSRQLVRNNYNGAVEHVAKNFTNWTVKLAQAITKHKNEEAALSKKTKKLIEWSGYAKIKHGGTEEEEKV